jgi:hypothetical protein
VARYVPRGPILNIFLRETSRSHVVVQKLVPKFEAAILFPDELGLSETQANACAQVQMPSLVT